MDTIDRRVFRINDVEMAHRIAVVHDNAFNISNRLEETTSSYRSLLNGLKGNIKIYGINNIHGLIGFAHYELAYRRAILDTLAIRSDYQRMRIGSLLLKESLLDLACTEDIRVVNASVVGAEHTLAFYKFCGFTNRNSSQITEQQIDHDLQDIKIMIK